MTAAADLEFALELADAAAELTMGSFGGRHGVELKSDQTPVTEIDAAVERRLRTLIGLRYPDDGVLGEEGGNQPGTSGRVWVIDPIDGTKLYAEGIPLWSTLIALRDGDEVVVGVADAPAMGDRCHARKGGGAWQGTQRLHVSDVSELSQAFVLHPSLGDLDDAMVASLLQLARAARGVRGISDAWAHLLVARGSAEALVEVAGCNEWDWAATSLIVSESGGRLTALDGGPLHAGCGLLVSNGLVDNDLRAFLPDGYRDQ